MIRTILTTLLTAIFFMSFAGAKSEMKLEKKAHRIHEKCLTLDTH